MKQLQLKLEYEPSSKVPSNVAEAKALFFSKYGFDRLFASHEAARHNLNQSKLNAKDFDSRTDGKTRTYSYFLPYRQRRFTSIHSTIIPFEYFLPFNRLDFSKNKSTAEAYAEATKITIFNVFAEKLFNFKAFYNDNRFRCNENTTYTLDAVFVNSHRKGFELTLFASFRIGPNGEEISLLSPKNTTTRVVTQYAFKRNDARDIVFDYSKCFTEVKTPLAKTPSRFLFLESPDSGFLFIHNQFMRDMKTVFTSIFPAPSYVSARHLCYADYAFQSFVNAYQRFFLSDKEIAEDFCHAFIDVLDGYIDIQYIVKDFDYYDRFLVYSYNNYLKKLFYSKPSALRDLFSEDLIPIDLINDRLNSPRKDLEHLNVRLLSPSIHSMMYELMETGLFKNNFPYKPFNWAIAKTLQIVKTDRFIVHLKDAYNLYYPNNPSVLAKIDYTLPTNIIDNLIISFLTFYSYVHYYHSHELDQVETLYPSDELIDFIFSNAKRGYVNTNVVVASGFPLTQWTAFIKSPHCFSHQKIRRFFTEAFSLEMNLIGAQTIFDLSSMITNLKNTCAKMDDPEYDFKKIIKWRDYTTLKIAHNEISKIQTLLRYPNIKNKNEFYQDLDGLSLQVPDTCLTVVFAEDTNTVRVWGTTQRHCIANYSDYINNQKYVVFGVWDNTKNAWYGHCIFNVEGPASNPTGYREWQFYGLQNHPLDKDEKKLINDFVFDTLFVKKKQLLAEKKLLEESATSDDEYSIPIEDQESQLVST